MEQVVLVAEFVTRKGVANDVCEMLLEYRTVVRNEPGNLVFTCHQQNGQPETFMVYEVYRDQSAFNAHISSHENGVFNRKLVPLLEGNGVRLTFLTTLGAGAAEAVA